MRRAVLPLGAHGRSVRAVTAPPLARTVAPSPATASVTDARDPLDFPYELAGLGYLAPAASPRPRRSCPTSGGRTGSSTSAGSTPSRIAAWSPSPPEEHFPGEAPGSDVPSSHDPRDIGHERFWDIHVWRSDAGTPAASIVNPGKDIPGIDPEIGFNWFYPAFRAGVPGLHVP